MGFVLSTLRAAIIVGSALAIGASANTAHAQLAPLHACALFKRPIEMSLRVPDGAVTISVELIIPATGQVLETRVARPGASGKVDLAELFPRLWSTDSPQVLYAQALAGKGSGGSGGGGGGERIGAPVVLVPMIAPRYASRNDKDGTPQVNPAPKFRVLSGYWTNIDQHVEITTSKGRLTFALRPEAAPNSSAAFRDLVARGFYDGITIHRVASLSGRTLPDIIQFGDPTGTGQGGPGFFIDFEPSPIKHAFGTLSFARTTDPNSAGSQVLISLGRESASQLDGRYAVFAQLVVGAQTLATIAKTPTDAEGKPRESVTIESAKLVDAPPFGTGPQPETDPLEKPPTR